MPPKGRRKQSTFYSEVDRFQLSDETLWSLTLADMRISAFETPVQMEGFGPGIVLMFRQGGKTFGFEVTNWNLAEITEFKQLMDALLDISIVIVNGRDEAARNAEDKSDRIFKRLYRPIPKLVATARAKRLDPKSVLLRPIDVVDVDDGADQ